MEILFVNPGNSSKIYQGLSRNLSAIEPPTWALLLAEATRSKGYETGILDVNAENLDLDSAYRKIEQLKPRLICFVVYGQNVNAGTASMSGAAELANYLKAENNNLFIGIIGSYVQALPKKVLSEEKSFDLIFTNEGVFSILELLSQKNFDDKSLMNVSGVAFRNSDNKFVFTQPGKVVPSNQLDDYLPGYAWDLLPYATVKKIKNY